MSLKEMKDELRALRKEAVKPVSKLKKADVLSELERLREKRESVPPVAATLGPKPKKMEATMSDVKVAKEKGFPMKPVDAVKAKKDKGSAVPKTTAKPKKEGKMERLMKMIDAMSDSE